LATAHLSVGFYLVGSTAAGSSVPSSVVSTGSAISRCSLGRFYCCRFFSTFICSFHWLTINRCSLGRFYCCRFFSTFICSFQVAHYQSVFPRSGSTAAGSSCTFICSFQWLTISRCFLGRCFLGPFLLLQVLQYLHL